MRHIVSPDSVTISCTKDLNAVAAIFKWKKTYTKPVRFEK